MLTRVITGPRAWRAQTLDNRGCWYYRLSEAVLAALDRTIRELRAGPQPITALQVVDTTCAGLAGELQPVRTVLETGRGFAILEGIPQERYTASQQQVIYWLLGQLLGRPYPQNVQGTLLYDVRDTGQDVRYGARFSVTNAESGFHTDNSFGTEVADYVGLLCLNTAQSGGVNRVVSVYTVHNELLTRHPDVLEVLYQPFHIDRRGGVRPGEAPTVQSPVLEWDGRGLVCRYLRYWIEAGHARAEQPLTPAQVRALDVLDEVVGQPELWAEFALKPGHMFFINNRWILHNRTAFEDHAEPERRRHLVRLWLQAPAA